MPTPGRQPPIEQQIARLAERQHGVAALSQLAALGLKPSTARDWAARGRLHRLYRGVYAIGHRGVSSHGRQLAAVLACGPGAVLSHRSAAALLGLRQTARRNIDVTAPRRSSRPHAGIDLHRAGTLLPRDATVADGIPCTSVARTLLDLAEVVDRHTLQRALERSETLRVFDLRAVDDVIARGGGRRGAPRLRRAVDAHQDTVVRSVLEEHFIALCEDRGLPRPKVNLWLPRLDVEVDFCWPAQGLVVETDGRAHHGTPRARARDRRKAEKLAKAGYRVLRKAYGEVADSPEAVAREVLDELRSPGSSARRRPRAA